MKLVFVLALLVLGLVSARPVEDEDVTELELMDEDFDLDMEGMTLDEARKQWKLLGRMYEVVDQLEGMHKRSFGSFFKKIKDGIVKAAKKVGHFFKNTYQKAKAAFKKVVKKIHFSAVLKKLKPLIHSGMTVKACTKVCNVAGGFLLGTEAGSAKTVCGSICEGALSKLEDVVG